MLQKNWPAKFLLSIFITPLHNNKNITDSPFCINRRAIIFDRFTLFTKDLVSPVRRIVSGKLSVPGTGAKRSVGSQGPTIRQRST
jgi:hypothetical protein